MVFRRHSCSCGLTVAFLSVMVGCRTGAPIHVWTPPEIISAVDKKVAVAPLAGPRSVAQRVESQLFRTVPRDAGRAIEAIPAETLLAKEPIRLASAAEQMPSDLALLPSARHQGIDYLLMGEVLEDRSRRPTRAGRNTAAGHREPLSGSASRAADKGGEPDDAANPYQQRVSVAWRVYDVAEARPLADQVLVASADAVPMYGEKSGSPDARLQPLAADAVSGRQVWRLLSPTVERGKVSLAVPWLIPGSKAVRRGNEWARQGHWPEAERLWRRTLEQHPSQHAAKTNLAIAAAARQDFSLAKRLIREAIQQRSRGLYEQTLGWIEMRQRDYHEAFGLPDPPEGWFVTASSAQTP